MLNAHDLSTDTLVSTPGKITGITALTMQRGNVTFGVQFCNGTANANVPAETTVFFGLKLTSNPKGPWLSLVQLQPIAGSTGLYQGLLQNNTPEMVAATHADPADPLPEIMSLPVYGQLYYILPGNTEPNFSQFMTVTVTGVLWTGQEGLAPSPNAVYPSAAVLAATVAAVAALSSPVDGGTAGTVYTGTNLDGGHA